jgi:Leucine-rich repeat (LRR) protein
LEDIAPLHILHLSGQREFGGFTGKLPNFTTSLHLHEIDVSKNSLTGSIPSSFLEGVRKSGNHDDYAYDKIDLSSNQITGTVPEDWNDFVGLFAYLAGNRITGVPGTLCDDDNEFMDCLVGNLTTNKCDAILCPPGTSLPQGRQIDASVPCQPCPGETPEERELQAPYYGMFACKPNSKERSILEQLYGLIFTDTSDDTYWMTDNPICSWFGITCEDETADSGVMEVKLESNSLETDDPDKVSTLFFDLPNLRKLDLRGNDKLQLKLDDIWKPTQLESLHISATGITSIVGIGMATNLKELQ